MGFGARRINFVQKVQWHDLKAVGTHRRSRQARFRRVRYGRYLPRYGRVWKVRSGRYGTVQYKYSNLYLTFYLFILESEKEREGD